MILPITSICAAVLTLVYIALTLRVINMRRSKHIALGMGEDESFIRAVRAHSNFAEYTPLFLILLTLLEMQQASFVFLAGLASLFIFGRIVHAIGFGVIGRGPGRVVGMVCTNTALIILAITLLYLAL